MFEIIYNCRKCELYKNQPPLLDEKKECKVLWVGLSAKRISCKGEKPLSSTTNSGNVIQRIEDHLKGVEMYRTNLVKCLPLDDLGKLRYPKNKEILCCLPHLKFEISELAPQIVFLLGKQVSEAVGAFFSIHFEKTEGYNYKFVQFKNLFFVPIHHPSYVYTYKRKELDKYIKKIESIIYELLCYEE